jgi:hypothetical protein
VNDESLAKSWDLAKDGIVKILSDGGSSKLLIRKQLLYREFSSPKVSNGKQYRQLMIPTKFRTLVMKLAYEALMAGHLGVKKTTERVQISLVRCMSTHDSQKKSTSNTTGSDAYHDRALPAHCSGCC